MERQFIILLKNLISLLIFVSFCKISVAQPVPFLSGAAHYGFIFAHSQDVQNTAGANPVGIAFGYGKADTSFNTFQACNCSVQKGLNLTYFNYDNKILGHLLALSYRFEPNFSLTQKFSLALKSEFGLAYQSNPYDAIKNPTNMSYSLPVTVYLGLAVGIKKQLNPNWSLGLYANYLHTSNGGIKDPNKGVNWPTANLQLQYFLKPVLSNNFQKANTQINKKSYFIVSSFFSSKTIAVGQKDRYLIYGLSANYTKPLSAINGLIAGIEGYNDLSLKKRLTNNNLNTISSIRSGITLGNVFLLGKFNFSQQVGFYIFNPSGYFPKFYHRWMLNYIFKHKLVAGISVKAHAHVANFLDFRLGYKLY